MDAARRVRGTPSTTCRYSGRAAERRRDAGGSKCRGVPGTPGHGFAAASAAGPAAGCRKENCPSGRMPADDYSTLPSEAAVLRGRAMGVPGTPGGLRRHGCRRPRV